MWVQVPPSALLKNMKIKSCPFCDCQKLILHQNTECSYIACSRCEIEQPAYKSKDTAILNWNLRFDCHFPTAELILDRDFIWE